ncbi:hypothetical protein HMPREF0262_01331 [Clostridium sp. ATCC 29733]|nr:hypothetical protein HMPREF0262_01331 [Clostridium sp. ATCC 29733]
MNLFFQRKSPAFTSLLFARPPAIIKGKNSRRWGQKRQSRLPSV